MRPWRDSHRRRQVRQWPPRTMCPAPGPGRLSGSSCIPCKCSNISRSTPDNSAELGQKSIFQSRVVPTVLLSAPMYQECPKTVMASITAPSGSTPVRIELGEVRRRNTALSRRRRSCRCSGGGLAGGLPPPRSRARQRRESPRARPERRRCRIHPPRMHHSDRSDGHCRTPPGTRGSGRARETSPLGDSD